MSFIYTYGVIYNITLIYDNKTSIIMCIIICILYIFFSFICVFQIKDLQIALFCLVVWDSKNYCSGDLNINNHWEKVLLCDFEIFVKILKISYYLSI